MLSGLSKNSFRLFLSGSGMSVRTGRYFLEAAFLGGIVGLVTAGFAWMIEAMGHMAEMSASWGGAWTQALLPVVGAVAGALVISRFAHVRHARGTDSAVHAFHQNEDIPRTVIPVKSVASVLTVACGGSAGYEGPVTLLGAACGRVVTRLLRLDRRAARILLAAGVGAGISALFRAPLAGAIFGAEIFYSSSDLEYEALLPSFIASTTSYTVFACIWGWGALFVMPVAPFEKGLHLLPYLVLALMVTFGARLYIMLFRAVEHSFGKARGPLWAKAAVGGLVVGVLAWAVPGWAKGLNGAGYEVVERCFAFSAGSDVAWSVPLGFLGFFALKMVATSFTVGSGGSGGVFAPALVCGGALGMAMGLFFLKVLPGWACIVPAEFALVGMAGFLASAIRVPIAAVVMVAEISGNHELLMPAMWVCGISFWLNNGWSLYRSQVHSRESSPLHRESFAP